MIEKYAIAILNNDEEYILKPFLSNIPTIERLIIITKKDVQYDFKCKISSFLTTMNVFTEFVQVNDITNFFQIFFIIRKMCAKYGEPEWLNISCGSGIGMAAMAIHAVNRDISMVTYEKDLDRSFTINVKQLRKINIFDERYLNLLRDIRKGYDTISKLSKIHHMDKSVVSRRLRVLVSMEIIEKKNVERKYPFIFYLSEFGYSLLENNDHS